MYTDELAKFYADNEAYAKFIANILKLQGLNAEAYTDIGTAKARCYYHW